MKDLLNAAEMKAVDKRSIEEYGIPSLVLMERAALEEVKRAGELLEPGLSGNEALEYGPGRERLLKERKRKTVWAVCGFGNNGADGAAAARSDITPGHNPALFRFGVWILFNIAALPLGAVAFHSSVIRYRGRGVLFLGESGTGKSTHTRLWREHIPGAELLNDDSPIIRATDSEALVHGSPWSGKTPCYRNESCPIAAVVRLSQASHNRIRRLRPIESIGALLPSAPPAFARDERLSDDTCGLLSRLIAQVPVYHLECLPDAAAAQLACRTVFNDATL